MYKEIGDFSSSIKKKIAAEFYQGKHVKNIAHDHELSVNEVLAVLNDRSVDSKRLRRELSTVDIFEDRFIVIADTHIGSIRMDMEMIKYVYEYAKKAGIKNIFHAGDLIQSTMRPTNPQLRDEYKQITYLIDNYPEVQGITTHVLFGNHDFHTLKKDDNLIKVIDSRTDFNILGFKRAYFTWNKYLLNIRHEIDKYKLEIPNVDTQVMLCGHRHEFYVHGHDKVMLPCLCGDVKNYHTSLSLPGFIEVFKDGDKLRIVSHSFLPENYEERIFESDPRKVTLDYSRKLNKNFKIG
jgi:predicted phosphodiesterase